MANATDELRRMLDERGIEWRSGLEGVTFVGDWCFVEYDNGKLAATCEPVLTPEQAIAATLGNDAKLCHATEANYRQCKYSTNRGWCDDAPFLVWDDIGHLFITMGGLKTWDVTDDAKTWFAMLGGGECEMDAHGNCTACGEFVAKSLKYVHTFDDGYEAKPCRAHNYCPNCGARVRKAVKR